MAVQLNINTANIPVATSPDPVPAAWYPTVIVESEMKPTSSGNGAYLELTHEIIEGPYKGRKLWDRLNLQNANPLAVEIAYKQLSAICHAVNRIQIGSSAEIHNLPMMTKVSYRAAGVGANGQNHDASNEVKGYKAYEAAAAAPVQAPVAPPMQPATPAAAAPWQQPAAAQAPAAAAQAPAPWQQPGAPAQAPVQQPAAPAAAPWAAPAQAQAPAAAPWQQPAAAAAPAQAPWQQPGAVAQAPAQAPAGMQPPSNTPPWAQQQ